MIVKRDRINEGKERQIERKTEMQRDREKERRNN